MLFIDSSDIKFGIFLNYVFHNAVNEIGSKKYERNCGQSFRDGYSMLETFTLLEAGEEN